jgi:hypothetical protein
MCWLGADRAGGVAGDGLLALLGGVDQRHAAAGQDVDAEVATALGLARILLHSHRQTRRRRTRLNQQATTANCG